jgi:hypothetical protein
MDPLQELAAAVRRVADLLDELDRPELTPPPSDPPPRRLLSYADAAMYIGVGERTMKSLGGPNGQIVQTKIGARVLFDVNDLDEYVERIK